MKLIRVRGKLVTERKTMVSEQKDNLLVVNDKFIGKYCIVTITNQNYKPNIKKLIILGSRSDAFKTLAAAISSGAVKIPQNAEINIKDAKEMILYSPEVSIQKDDRQSG